MPTLTWLTRDEDLKRTGAVPYRLLEAEPALSHGDPAAGNMLIQGDNLDALKALLPYYAGRVKCIYIDPPYNTRSAFEHYDDNLEHSQWLAMIYPRLELLRDLLSEDGSIWVSIDDNEGHYLKVVMDEVFGRSSFVANVVWQKRYSRDNNSAIGNSHDHIFLYAKNYEAFKQRRNRLPLDEKSKKPYRNDFKDGRGLWRPVPMHGEGFRPNQMYSIVAPGGAVHHPPEGRHWAIIEPRYRELEAEGRIYFGKDNNSQPNTIRFLSEVDGLTPWTWWTQEEVGHNDEAKKEGHDIFGKSAVFGTPKPERLLQRIVHIATNPGDLILDSFLGSGTTAAVAHKMDRRWIGVEMGDHAVSHCVPRLQKVIEGEQGGISEAVGWKGGGGFTFYRLGEPVFDEDGRIRRASAFRRSPRMSGFRKPGGRWPARRRRRFWGPMTAGAMRCSTTAFSATSA
jgi:adenine-specific DNA-methyltransferase